MMNCRQGILGQIIKQIPLPACGLTLGVAALGNMLSGYSNFLSWGYGIVAVTLWILLLFKCIFYWPQAKQELANPLTLSVFEAFFMTLLQISIYSAPYFGKLAYFCWITANIGHIVLVVVFSQRYLNNFQLSSVYTTWNILYSGNMLAAVAAPLFHLEQAGQWIFWIGFFGLLPCYPISTYRYWKLPVTEAVLPTLCVLAAPFNLSLAAYLSCTDNPSVWFTLLLACIAQGMYLYVLFCLPRILKTPFTPSYGALTFPFVISAVALQKLLLFFTDSGISYPELLHQIIFIEELIAVLIVTYVLIRYVLFLMQCIKEQSRLNC